MPPADRPLLSYLVGRLDRAVRNELAVILEPFELSIAQFTALSVLGRRPGLSNAQLARRALITPQSMIEVTAALESRGLLARVPDPGNARVLRAQLTPAGRRLLARAERATGRLEAAFAGALGDHATADDVRALLERMLEAIVPAGGAGGE